jgi:hypothetical protein
MDPDPPRESAVHFGPDSRVTRREDAEAGTRRNAHCGRVILTGLLLSARPLILDRR